MAAQATPQRGFSVASQDLGKERRAELLGAKYRGGTEQELAIFEREYGIIVREYMEFDKPTKEQTQKYNTTLDHIIMIDEYKARAINDLALQEMTGSTEAVDVDY